MRILYVDDDLNMHKMVEMFMKNTGYEISSEKNGRSALRNLEKNEYDLIITDIQMPEMDGLTLINEIRKKDKSIPIIVVSAYGQDSMSEKALSQGANKTLYKPFDSKSLISLVKELKS